MKIRFIAEFLTCSSSWEKYSADTTGDIEASHEQLFSLGLLLVVVAAGLLVVVEGTKPSPESAEPVLVMAMQVPEPCPVRPQCQAHPLLSPEEGKLLLSPHKYCFLAASIAFLPQVLLFCCKYCFFCCKYCSTCCAKQVSKHGGGEGWKDGEGEEEDRESFHLSHQWHLFLLLVSTGGTFSFCLHRWY